MPGKRQVRPTQSQKFLPSAVATQPVIKGSEMNITIKNGKIGMASMTEDV